MTIEGTDVQSLAAIRGDHVIQRRPPFQNKATLAVREDVEGKQFWITIAGLPEALVETVCQEI